MFCTCSDPGNGQETIPCGGHVASQAESLRTAENSGTEGRHEKSEEHAGPRGKAAVLIAQRSLVQIQPHDNAPKILKSWGRRFLARGTGAPLLPGFIFLPTEFQRARTVTLSAPYNDRATDSQSPRDFAATCESCSCSRPDQGESRADRSISTCSLFSRDGATGRGVHHHRETAALCQ